MKLSIALLTIISNSFLKQIKIQHIMDLKCTHLIAWLIWVQI
jgi:hypothetical protein